MVIFYDSFRKYYVLVFPIELKDGNIGVLQFYRKKGRANSKPIISGEDDSNNYGFNYWTSPSNVHDAVSDDDFDKWFNYIIKKLDVEKRRFLLSQILSGTYKP